MDKKIKRKIDKMTQDELRSFVLERREHGDLDKFIQQSYAIDRLIEEVQMESKAAVTQLF